MTKIIHEILSKLHHLLSIGGPEDLRAAAYLPGTSAHVRTALEALAEERATTPKGARSRPGTGQKVAGASGAPKRSSASGAGRGALRSLENSSKEEIVELARSLGIEIRATGKDARSRVLRRLENAVKGLPEDKRQHVLSSLAGGIDRQTAGWVDVIKRGK